MLPTPDLSHLTKDDYLHVYEPAEDTFILLDALEHDVEEIKAANPRVCVEIGSGSGCVSAFVGQFLGSTCLYIATDVNSRASECTVLSGRQNKVEIDAVTTSLTDALNERLGGIVDILIFNPPYVPTISDEVDKAQGDRGIAGAWAGGLQGMEVTENILRNLKHLLSKTGRFYLVAVKDNDIPSIQRRVKVEQDMGSEIVLQRRAGREHLFVIKIYRATDS